MNSRCCYRFVTEGKVKSKKKVFYEKGMERSGFCKREALNLY